MQKPRNRNRQGEDPVGECCDELTYNAYLQRRNKDFGGDFIVSVTSAPTYAADDLLGLKEKDINKAIELLREHNYIIVDLEGQIIRKETKE